LGLFTTDPTTLLQILSIQEDTEDHITGVKMKPQKKWNECIASLYNDKEIMEKTADCSILVSVM
jgi:hypothetical protein